MPLNNIVPLTPETDAERAEKAKVTPADVIELRSRIQSSNVAGQVLTPQGLLFQTSAAKTKALMNAQAEPTGVVGQFEAWIEGQLG